MANQDPKEHRHYCASCGRQFVCHFACELDVRGAPVDGPGDECDSCCDKAGENASSLSDWAS